MKDMVKAAKTGDRMFDMSASPNAFPKIKIRLDENIQMLGEISSNKGYEFENFTLKKIPKPDSKAKPFNLRLPVRYFSNLEMALEFLSVLRQE